MKRIIKLSAVLLSTVFIFFGVTTPAFAVTNSEISSFTSETLGTFIGIASLAATFFLVKGGYDYITSSGKPENLYHAKKTIRNALLGLTLIIGAGVLSSLLSNAFNTPNNPGSGTQIALSPIVPAEPSGGLTQVLLDAFSGFMQNILQSAVKPIIDGIVGFLTSTPQILNNSVIFNFWLVILGITNSLFALIIALLGLQFMSASSFGFEEMEFKQLLPRIGLAFLGANISIFLADWVVLSCNKLVQALLNATGGLGHAWIITAFDPISVITGQTRIITLIFMILFLILSIVLILFYISRSIMIAFGAAISPLIFLLWAIPKTSDFAEISIKTYLVGVYAIFIQVVIIQLASAFFAVPDQSGANPLVAILIGVGLMLTLLKVPGTLQQFAFYSAGRGAIKKLGGQLINVMSSSKTESEAAELAKDAGVKAARKVVHA